VSGALEPKQPANLAVIHLSAARSVHLNGELMVRNMADGQEVEFFLKRMKELAATEPRPRIRVDLERASTYQDLMFVTDACSKAGFNQVGTHIWGGKLP
jgi:biopolymer transport protein ExbD